MRRTEQRGFTLIELIVVIVILGILAATAIPKFVSMTAEAADASAKGTAGAIASGAALNYAVKLVNTNSGTAVVNTTTCAAVVIATLAGNTLPDTNLTLAGGPLTCPGGSGDIDSACTIKHTSGPTTYPIRIICTG